MSEFGTRFTDWICCGGQGETAACADPLPVRTATLRRVCGGAPLVRSLVFAQVEAALCNQVAEFGPVLPIRGFAASVKAELATFLACGISAFFLFFFFRTASRRPLLCIGCVGLPRRRLCARKSSMRLLPSGGWVCHGQSTALGCDIS